MKDQTEEKETIDPASSEVEGEEAIEVEVLEEEDTTEEVIDEEKKQLEEDYKQTYDRLVRLQAEYDNFKKRTQREKESAGKYKAQDIAEALLPVLDNFERALTQEVNEEAQGFKDGIDMVYRQFIDALKLHGIEEIKAVGEEFDPNLHHAVLQDEQDDQPENIVLEEMQKGYVLKDRVIRPAMVKVNK